MPLISGKKKIENTSMYLAIVWLFFLVRVKRFGVQSPPTPKTDWCFGLMIKSYYQEWTP